MDTLRAIRKERITHLADGVFSDADTALITIKLEEDSKQILIVERYSESIVQQVLNNIDKNKSGYVFFASELALDPLNNCMVPKHRKATAKEINDLVYKRRIPLDKLPILCMNDPIRRWHNFNKGSIVAIERPNEQHVYFRRVV